MIKSFDSKLVLLTLAIGICLSVCLACFSQTPSRPNILFILSDDHAWQAVSAYNESRHLVQTPNIQQMDTLSPFEYRKVHYSRDSNTGNI